MIIAFEGIDGTGKTTQSKKLQQYMKSINIVSSIIKFPPGNQKPPVDENEIQSVCRHMGNFARYYQLLKDAHNNYTNVILDRYFFSTAAYQPTTHISPQDVINIALSLNLPIPDVTFCLSAPVKSILSRLTPQDKPLAQDGTLQRAIRHYNAIARVSEYNFIVIDATGNEETVFNQIVAHITPKIHEIYGK